MGIAVSAEAEFYKNSQPFYKPAHHVFLTCSHLRIAERASLRWFTCSA
jgi:hypothetical protein